MTSTTEDLELRLAAAGALARARAARETQLDAEATQLEAAVAWGRLHEVSDLGDAATWQVRELIGADAGIPLAGEGAPLVSEACVVELTAALGMGKEQGRQYMADALELAYRLPRLYARVVAREVPAWRARMVARQTTTLSLEAVRFVDAQVAPFAHKMRPAEIERLVEFAIATFMPDYAAEKRERAADRRHFDVHHEQVSFQGTALVEAEMDLADALDLDAAVAAGAEERKALGSTEPLDVRRAKAAGELARRQLALGFAAEASEASEEPVPAKPSPRRSVNLYVHLSADVLGDRQRGGSDVALVENAGTQLVTADTIREWLGVDGTKVSVRPVIDLNERLVTSSYAIPEVIREAVVLLDRHCVFPGCGVPARQCDLDHVVPYADGGPTATDNLAPLCRLHHRAKTHFGWRYRMVGPGVYEWLSPYGYRFLVDGTGTDDVTPPPERGPAHDAGP